MTTEVPHARELETKFRTVTGRRSAERLRRGESTTARGPGGSGRSERPAGGGDIAERDAAAAPRQHGGKRLYPRARRVSHRPGFFRAGERSVDPQGDRQ